MISHALFTLDATNTAALVVHDHKGRVDYKPLTRREALFRMRELADLLSDDTVKWWDE